MHHPDTVIPTFVAMSQQLGWTDRCEPRNSDLEQQFHDLLDRKASSIFI